MDIKVLNREMIVDIKDYYIANSVNYEVINFEFDSAWDSFDKTVIFKNEDVTKEINIGLSTSVTIPHEVLKEGVLYLSIVGLISEPYTRITTKEMGIGIQVFNSGDISGDSSSIPTPTVWESYLLTIQGLVNTSTAQSNIAIEKANLAKGYADNAKASADSSYDASLVSIEKEYLSAQSAEQTTADKTTVAGLKNDVVSAKSAVDQTISDFNSQKGVANGLASLDANSKVVQVANNSDKLNNHADSYFATAESLNTLTDKVNTQVADLSYNSTTGVFTKTVNTVPSNMQITGLLSSVTEDTLGDVTFTMKDGSAVVWHKGKDNFVSSSYYDTATQELVMTMVSGSEVRIPVSGLIDVYTGGLTDNVNITVDGHTIFADVIVSTELDNILEERTTGLYVKHPKNLGYKTLTENNLLYLGIDATAKNSEKLGNKLEGELNVANADTADKLTTAKTITLNGAVSGTVSTDLSGNVEIATKNEILGYHVVDVASLTDYTYNWDVSLYNSLIIVSNTAIKINFVNLVGGFVGTIHYYSDNSTGLDEAYLATQGFVLDNDIYGLITKTTVDQCYHYYFDYDSVKKSVSRMVK